MFPSRIFWTGAIGNIIEWYDFALYGYLAPLFAKLFFSHQSPIMGLLIIYGILSASFIARPIGGIIFGHIGDHFGRRSALILSVSTITLFSFLLGILPTQQTIGYSAPLLLVILRILQGLSAGGEISGSFIYVLESVDNNRRGFFGGAIWSMIVLGILLASGVIAVISSIMSDAHFQHWGWRITYFIGSLLGLFALFLRTHMPESQEFIKLQAARKIESSPLISVIKHYKLLLLKIIGLVAVAGAGFYLPFLYLPVFANQFLVIPINITLIINSITQCILFFGMIFFGWLSDHFSRKLILLTSVFCTFAFSYLLLYWLKPENLLLLFVVQTFFALLLAMYEGPLASLLVEIIPIEVRYSVMAIGYGISFAIFGGFAPLISTYLIHITGNSLTPSFYLMLCALLSFISVCMSKTKKT